MTTERRLATPALELRLSGDGMTFEGYAAVFNADSEKLPFWGVERIAPGAFSRSLADPDADIRMFLNHNSDDLLASSKAGTLRLSEDERGLRVEADLPDTQAGRDLATLIRRGDVRSMSFGFQPVHNEPRSDGTTGTVHTEVRLLEVSPVTSWPAYAATTAAVRSIESDDDFRAALRRCDELTRRIEGIVDSFEASGERSLTRSKERDLADARHELRAMLDRLPPTDAAGLGVERVAHWLDETDDLGTVVDAAHEVRNAVELRHRMWISDLPEHSRLRDAVTSSITGTRMNTSHDGPSISALFNEYRESGYAAAEFSLSTSFESRALASAGGSAIPTTFYDKVTVYERALSPMFNPSVVTLLETRTGEDILLPRLTGDVSHGGTVTAEAAAISELDPTISSVTLDSYKYGVITNWSSELDLDNVIGIEDLIARTNARELAIDIGAHLTTGDGSAKPNGIITAAGLAGTAAATANNTFFGAEDLVDTYFSVAPQYRAEGVWLVSNTAYAKILKLVDANGQPMLHHGFNGAPSTLMGRPIYENPAMAAVASASKSVLFGATDRYFVRRVSPLRVELSRDYKWSTDQVSLRVIERVDGDLVDTDAVKVLVSANA